MHCPSHQGEVARPPVSVAGAWRLHALLLVLLSAAAGSVAEPADQERRPVIEAIEVAGNTKSGPHVVLRHLTIEVGDPATPEALVAGKDRLAGTRFFKSVDVHTRPGTEKGQLIVVVTVEERKWPYFRPVGGHDGLNGWYIAPIGFCFDNFSGRGHYLDWQSSIGHRISREAWHYRHPEFRDGSAYLDVELFGKTEQYRHYIRLQAEAEGTTRSAPRLKFDEEVKSSGVNIRIGGRSGMPQHTFIAWRSEGYKPERNPVLELYMPGEFRNTYITSLTLGRRVDSRDNAAYPLKGYWGTLSGGAAMKAADGHAVFPKLVLDVRRYCRTSGRKVFALRVKAAYTGSGAPFYERFYLGGPYSLRGHRTGSLTPVGWGTKLLLVQSEMRFPLSIARFPEHRHTAVLWGDAGGCWAPGNVPGARELSHSLGVGYRLRVRALGMLRFDFALPTSGVDENDFHFQLSLGHAF